MRKLSEDKLVELRRLIEQEHLSHTATAIRLGVSMSAVERWCKRLSIPPAPGMKKGHKNPSWKGGRVLVGNYWYVHAPSHPHATKVRRVAEHRLVMEQKLGRYLLPTEVVHHRDGNPQNNHPDNLEAFPTNGDHLRVDIAGRCPKWTPEGRARIEEGVKLAAAIHRHTKTDDDLRLLSTYQKRARPGSKRGPHVS